MASIMRRIGLSFARLVGLAVMILGALIFIVNIGDRGWDSWILVWILASGLLGAMSGLAFLFSFDGPDRFKSRSVRVLGWLGMLVSVSLPTSLTFILVPMVLLALPTVFIPPRPVGGSQ